MNIYKKLAEIKQALLETEIKKSGKNAYAGFKYFELDDILPRIIMLNNQNGVDCTIQISNDIAKLVLTNTDDCNDFKEVTIPYVEAQMLGKNGSESKVDNIQRLGASITYLRRYLYMTAYDITEKDIIDALDNTSNTPSQRMQILELINGQDMKPAEVAAIIKEITHDKIEADNLKPDQFKLVMTEIKKRLNESKS